LFLTRSIVIEASNFKNIRCKFTLFNIFDQPVAPPNSNTLTNLKF
jgi:hypothetical protein